MQYNTYNLAWFAIVAMEGHLAVHNGYWNNEVPDIEQQTRTATKGDCILTSDDCKGIYQRVYNKKSIINN